MNIPTDLSNNHPGFPELESRLTPVQISQFIQKVIPELKFAYNSLEQAMNDQQWEVAAKQAHQLKSTIGLLSNPALTTILNHIESKDYELIQLPDFRLSLVRQYRILMNTFNNYLADKKP